METRRHIGMVFQKPNPFPAMTIAENVLAGLRFSRVSPGNKDDLVEESLTRAGLWNEVKDRLGELGGALSGGQQQRLCIARALAVKPRVLLMDEPCSALDPTSTLRIEETIKEIADEVTVVIVTHNMQQAQRVSGLLRLLPRRGEPARTGDRGRTHRDHLRRTHRPKDVRLCQRSIRLTGRHRARAGRRRGRRRCSWSLGATQLWGALPAGASPNMQSTGSSFAGVAIQQWVGTSNTLFGLNINWQVQSSIIGLNQFATNQVDFGASDIPYSSGQAQSSPNQPYQYLPDVAGGLAFMFNLNGQDGSGSPTSTSTRR